MGEIIKHDEEQTPIKVSLDSVPVVRQSNVEISDFEEALQQCIYHMRDIITYKSYRCIYQQNAYFLSRAIGNPAGFIETWKNLCTYEEPGRLAFTRGVLQSVIQQYLTSYQEKAECLESYFSINDLAAEYEAEFKGRAQTALGNLLTPGYFRRIAEYLQPIFRVLNTDPKVFVEPAVTIINQNAEYIQNNNAMYDGSEIHYHNEQQPVQEAPSSPIDQSGEPFISHTLLEQLYEINEQMPYDSKKFYFLNVSSKREFYDYWDLRPMSKKLSIAKGGANRFFYLIRVLYHNGCIKAPDFEEWLKTLFENTEGLSDIPWKDAYKRYSTNTIEYTNINHEFEELLKNAGLSIKSVE